MHTPPTIVAPLVSDPRIFALAQATGLTRREAFGAAAEAWYWLAVMATDGLVVKAAPDALTALVDVAGFGPAMVEAGLVGVVDGGSGLVLPAELRRRERGQRGGGSTADAEDQDDRVERERKEARIRQRRSRAQRRTTKPASKEPSPQPVAEDIGPKRTPRRLGEVEGYSVMLLFSRQGVPFYALKGATPKEFTATVSDPDNPSLGDAFKGLLHAMKREASKGLGMRGTDFRPTMEQVVAAARKEKGEPDPPAEPVMVPVTDQQPTAAEEPRRVLRPHRTLCARARYVRDKSVTVTPVTGDTVTVTEVSRPEGGTCPPNSSVEADLGIVTRHDPVTDAAPSSSSICISSSSLSQDNEEERRKQTQETTTTSSVTDDERDRQDRILDRMLDQVIHDDDSTTGDDDTLKQRKRKLELANLFAQALGLNVSTVLTRWKTVPQYLRSQLEQAGIDPNTGHPFARGASHEPAEARDDIVMTTDTIGHDKPATGVVVARDGDEPNERDHDRRGDVQDIVTEFGLKTTADMVARFNAAHEIEDDAATSVTCGPL